MAGNNSRTLAVAVAGVRPPFVATTATKLAPRRWSSAWPYMHRGVAAPPYMHREAGSGTLHRALSIITYCSRSRPPCWSRFDLPPVRALRCLLLTARFVVAAAALPLLHAVALLLVPQTRNTLPLACQCFLQQWCGSAIALTCMQMAMAGTR